MSCNSSFNHGYNDDGNIVHEDLDEPEVTQGPITGTSTRNQYKLAGKKVADNIPLPERRRISSSSRPSNLLVISEEASGAAGNLEAEGVFQSPRTADSLAWDEYSETPQFESSRGPSTGRSDKTFNYSGISTPGILEPDASWLTHGAGEDRRNLSSVDSSSGNNRRLAELEDQLDTSVEDDEFQEADSVTPIPSDRDVTPPGTQLTWIEEDDIEEDVINLATDITAAPDQGPRLDLETLEEEKLNPAAENLAAPDQQPRADLEDEGEVLEDPELAAAIMAEQAQLALHRAFIDTLDDTIEDDFDSVNVDLVEPEHLREKCIQAENEKKELRAAITFMRAHDNAGFVQNYEAKTADQRAKMVQFINKAQAKLVELRGAQAHVPRNPTEAAQQAARQIKAESVTSYHQKVIDDMKAITAGLNKLKVSATLDQGEFKKEEEMVKSLTKRVEVTTKEAQRIRSDAVDAGMAEEARKVETELRTLQEKHIAVSDLVVQQRLDRNLVSHGVSGSALRGSDISPPVFSGDPSDKSDYFKFVKDLDLYVAVKNPSNEELLRVLQTKCLKGDAYVACEHLRTKAAVMEYLFKTYGDAKLLINQQLIEVKKLGACSGDSVKQRGWALNAQSRLTYVRDLATEHKLEARLYNSSIAAEVQARLPNKLQDEFMLKLQTLEGGKALEENVVFDQLLTFITMLTERFTYRLRMQTKINEVEVIGVKPAPPEKGGYGQQQQQANHGRGNSNSKQAPRKNYAVQKYEKKDQNTQGTSKPERLYKTSSSGECTLCKVKHEFFYYCKHFINSEVYDRHKLTYQAGVCFRCLLMTGDIPYADRKKWFSDHQNVCNVQWVCKLEKCGERELNRQKLFLLCGYHAKKQTAEAENFVKTLDKNKIAPNVKFFNFFNVPAIMNISWNYNAGRATEMVGWNTLPDINEPAIYMMCYVQVESKRLLCFFDSGCMTATVNEKVAKLLNSKTMRKGPTEVSVAGGRVYSIDGGEERFSLPLADGKTRASFTAIAMRHVTTPFPEYELYQAGEDIKREYRLENPDGEDLPLLPDKVGGAPVDIMFGIRYAQFFPKLVYMMKNGLSIYRSPFLHSDGKDGILAGPHRSWREVGECSHVLNRVYSSAPSYPIRIEHEPEEVGDCEVVDVHGDLIGEDGLVPEETNVGCERQHCDKHSQEVYEIPPTWDLSHRIYNSMSKEKVIRYMEGEDVGSVVDYRCPACRNCLGCKRGELLEQVSLTEEREQYAIEKSVRYDRVNKQLIARLPFVIDPVCKLTPNLHIAKKVFCSQLAKATKDENVRLGMVKSFNKLCDKGYVMKVKDLPSDLQEKVNSMVGYVIPWRTVAKEDSISTPIRLVFDASSRTPGGESLNDAIAKGINTLGNLFSILLRFRLKKEAFTGDVSMAYNGVRMDPDHIGYQQFLWQEEMKELSPLELWVVLTLIYGVRSAGNQTIEGFHQLADEAERDPQQHQADLGARVLRREAYMDDLMSAQHTKKLCIEASEQLKYVLSLGSMQVKEFTFSGTAPTEAVSSDGVHVGLLGMQWDSEKDRIRVHICELFLGKRRRGKTPETIKGDLEPKLAKQFTRRTLVGKVASVYDPLGLLVPITAKYKLQLAEICKLSLGWDDPIPPSYLKLWCETIQEIQTLGSIYFARSIVPEDAANTNISYIVSSDASQEIAISCVHSRILKKDGTYHVQILAAKSKIITKLTIPRAELKGVVAGSALGYCVAKDTDDRLEDMIHVTDSTICLFWLSQDQRPLKTGVRNAVLEVRRLTDLESWYHVQSEDNVADIGTRAEVEVDMSENSEWVSGKAWMRLEKSKMPLKTISQITLDGREKSLAALETKNQDIHGMVLHNLITKVGQRHSFSNYLMDPTRYAWPKSVRVMAVVMRFIDMTLKRKWERPWFPENKSIAAENANDSVHHSPHASKSSLFSNFEIERAENYFFLKATQEVKQFGKKQDWANCKLSKQKILFYNSRVLDGQTVENQYREGLDVETLMFVRPVCDRYSPVAYAIMSYSHSTLARHRNMAETVRQSLSIAFIYGGRDLAKEIREACPFCTRYKQRLLTREMGKINDNRFIIAPPFYSANCDLFGPLEAICEHSHRSTVKVWGLVFKCPSSGAIACYAMTKYDTAAFLMGYTRHASRYGHPAKVIIDAGSQLVKAVNDMQTTILDMEGVIRLQHQVGVQFEIVPVGSHYQNGVAERGIKEVKGLFKQLYGGLRMDIMSYETAFAFIANELNCFPACLASKTKDLDKLDIITPSRLMHGRNNRRCLSGSARADLPSKVIKQMQQTTEAWWEVWQTQYITNYVAQPRKWRESGGKVSTGDIVVFLKSPAEMAVGEPVWRVGRVVDLVEGRTGNSRALTIEYRNSTEKTFRTTKVDSRQAAVLHHEGELDLVDQLNEASRVVNINFIKQNVASSSSTEKKHSTE